MAFITSGKTAAVNRSAQNVGHFRLTQPHGVMGHRIDPSESGPIEPVLVPASAP